MLVFIAVIISIAIGAVLDGWALSVLWKWFIIPTFHLPGISIPQAIGIGLIVSFLTYQYNANDTNNWEDIFKALGMEIVKPLLVVFLGGIAYQFT